MDKESAAQELAKHRKKSQDQAVAALIIIDVQNDFFEGEMAVENAHQIIPIINKLRKNKLFKYVFQARDWHPKGHISFQSNNPGTQLYQQIKNPETGEEVVMWPNHCIQGTHGAQFHKDLIVDATDIHITKGTKKKVDAFSAFGSDKEDTGLHQQLLELEVDRIYCVGIALDCCVGFTAQDAVDEGFDTYIIKDATKSVNPEEESSLYRHLEQIGVTLTYSKDL